MRLVKSDGTVYELKEGKTRIGRTHENDIVVPDPRVSRQHAVIVKDGNCYMLRDMKSTNGTFYNEQRLTTPWLIEDGASLRIGSTTFQVEAGTQAAKVTDTPGYTPADMSQRPKPAEPPPSPPVSQPEIDAEINKQTLGVPVIARGNVARGRTVIEPIATNQPDDEKICQVCGEKNHSLAIMCRRCGCPIQ